MNIVPKASGPIFAQTLEKVILRRILQIKFHQSVWRTVYVEQEFANILNIFRNFSLKEKLRI